MNRSFHFLPGDKPHYFEKISSLGADWYIFDLEDAVAEDKKDYSRDTVNSFLKNSGLVNYFVRINSQDTSHYIKDAEMLKSLKIRNIVIPKADSIYTISEIQKLTEAHKTIVLIESFESFKLINDLKGLDIFCAGLGLEDMLADMPFDNDDLPVLIDSSKAEFALKCRMNGILPIDGIARDIFDIDELKKECVFAKASGYAGKFSVHPSHIQVINDNFYPSKESVSWAEFIKAETGFINSGYVRAASGEVITPPKIIKAKKILNYIKGEHE